MVTTWQNKSGHALNVGTVKQLFQEHSLLGQVTSFHEGMMDTFHGVRIMVTHNVRKEVGMVNGATGVVVAVLTRSALLVHFENGGLHPVWTISESENDDFRSGLPIRYAYASTLSKLQGRTLSALAVFPDPSVSAAGYVAMTRVRRLRDLFWVTQPIMWKMWVRRAHIQG